LNNHAGTVHLHIENRNPLADDDRQIQLNGFADFALLAWGDVGANASAVRSTDLAVSSRPARIFICWRP